MEIHPWGVSHMRTWNLCQVTKACMLTHRSRKHAQTCVPAGTDYSPPPPPRAPRGTGGGGWSGRAGAGRPGCGVWGPELVGGLVSGPAGAAGAVRRGPGARARGRRGVWGAAPRTASDSEEQAHIHTRKHTHSHRQSQPSSVSSKARQRASEDTPTAVHFREGCRQSLEIPRTGTPTPK
jgi:hypothetical protein